MTKDKFQTWLANLNKSGKSEEEVKKILTDIAKYSGLAIYEAIMTTLPESDMQIVEKIENEHEAQEKIEEFFKLRTGMAIDELVGKIQMHLIGENN